MVGHYYSKTKCEFCLCLCEWQDEDHSVYRNWFFEYFIPPEVMIRYDLYHQIQ